MNNRELHKKPLYRVIASLVVSIKNCRETNNSLWLERHTEKLEKIMRDHMPSGSGFDIGTSINIDACHSDKLVFNTEFHHMNEHGMYDGWTDHRITVRPNFVFTLSIVVSGRNKNQIKDYIYETFELALTQQINE